MNKNQLQRSMRIALVFLTLTAVAPINAADTFTLPDPIFAAMTRPVGDLYIVIWVGNLEGGQTPADVNLNSVLVNGNHVPASVEISPHAVFGGDALKISVLSTEFLPPYNIEWDLETESYSVVGEFNDESIFQANGTFTSVGRTSGDVNVDGVFNLKDLTYLVDNIYRGGPNPTDPARADANGSCGEPDLADLTYLVDRIFRSGSAPTHCAQ
ncbi:MAG: hypothetical protein ACREBV_09775, partial [Candidatus Zixiibacteriota bacterium]